MEGHGMSWKGLVGSLYDYVDFIWTLDFEY